MKNISFIKIISYSILLLPIVYFSYLYLTYIDKTVINGSAYGFSSGYSKNETYNKAKQVFSNEKVYIIYPVDEDGIGDFKVINFDGDYKNILNKLESWKFYFQKDDFRDYVELTFEGDNLFSIYRKRQKFEFP